MLAHADTVLAAGTSAIFETEEEVSTIKGWITTDLPEFKGKDITLERCYSASESTKEFKRVGKVDGIEGGTAAAFHKACDNKGPTLVVSMNKAPNNKPMYRYGGVADQSWESNAPLTHKHSNNSFLFCLNCAGWLYQNNIYIPHRYLRSGGTQRQGIFRLLPPAPRNTPFPEENPYY